MVVPCRLFLKNHKVRSCPHVAISNEPVIETAWDNVNFLNKTKILMQNFSNNDLYSLSILSLGSKGVSVFPVTVN